MPNVLTTDIAHDIHWAEAWLKQHNGSHMRCQLAMTLIACHRDMDIACLPAAYNMANDIHHFRASGLTDGDVRVLHYLREIELHRQTFLLPEAIDTFLSRPMVLSINSRLQDLVRDYRTSL
ncbi:hypothetical protein Sbs19_41740 [Sphingobium sp. BS19]|nr:hypothetical protein Sbs19_41740 [Sphingobium sp. BS19]